MSTSTCPRRTNANTQPAAVVLATKQTRRSSAVVTQEKAALKAQHQALIRKQEADLEHLHQLDQQLNAQAHENEAHAVRPPPIQQAAPTTTQNMGHAPAPATVPLTAMPPMAQSHAVAVDTESLTSTVLAGQASVERRVQAGRTRRLTRIDVEAHCANGAIPAGQEPSCSHSAAKENAAPLQDVPDVNHPVGRGSSGKKYKAESGGETSATKKGKPTKPSGPTAAAAATFAMPASLKRPPRSQPAASPLPPLPQPSASATYQPHGVYTQATDIHDLDDFEHQTLRRDHHHHSLLSSAQNIIQLEVVDVTTDLQDHRDAGGQPMAANLLLRVAPTPNQPVQPADVALPGPGAQPAQARGGPWTMWDLELILGPYLGDFTHSLVPKLINIIGNQAGGLWRLHGLDLKNVLQGIANEVWPMLTINVIPRQPFFDMAKQKLWEYRNGVANEAIEVVMAYMLSKRFESPEERVEYVNWALSEKDNWPFRYERVVETEDNVIKFYGAYQGTLISRVLAYHVKRIGIPVARIRDYPCNALTLATTAVERALKMWSTGALQRPRGCSEEAKFSERLWGRTANEYMGSIINLTEEQWDKILVKAELCARGLDEDSDDDDDDDGFEHSEDLPTTGRAVLMDADAEGY
ncbi:hypothetical protein V8D89_010978 [Ganoderma adspersum]